MPLQSPSLAVKKHKDSTDLLAIIQRDNELAQLAAERRNRWLRETPEFYVNQTGHSNVIVALTVLMACFAFGWFVVCMDKEIRFRERAIETLAEHGNNPKSLRDEVLAKRVAQAEELLQENCLFRAVCRMVTDSFLVTITSTYEVPFRHALLGAMQQDWFIALLCISFLAFFLALVWALIRVGCSRQLWVAPPPLTE